MDEDCLFLNVWAPGPVGSDAPGKPVMVWIHGGAYFRGASSQPLFDATTLAENGDVVVVSINYRIGVFGFVRFLRPSIRVNIPSSPMSLSAT